MATTIESEATIDKRAPWGLHCPIDAPHWGARAIFHNARDARGKRTPDLDVLYDRQGWSSDADEETRTRISEWFNSKGLKRVLAALVAQSVHPNDDTIVDIEDGVFRVKCSPRASFGYLYVVVWMVPS